jgi:AcrR family transcriptional regulator
MAMAARKRRYDMTARAAGAEQTRESILRATFDLLRAEHYDDVTIARIAAAAGVSPQTVTLHFRTKEGLVDALAQWWKPQEDALREVRSREPLEAARRVCARYEELGAATLRMLSIEGRVRAIQPILDQGRAGHREWVENTFGPRLGSGAARRLRAMQLVAIYDVYTWSVLRRVLDAGETVRAMADLARAVLDRKGDRP